MQQNTTASHLSKIWSLVYHQTDGEPKFLLLKSYDSSHQVERIAPVGNIKSGENPKDVVLRETSEIVWIPINQLNLWVQLPNDKEREKDRDMLYFLLKYSGDPDAVDITEKGELLWIYKWATIHEILTLVYSQTIRDVFRDAYQLLKEKNKKESIKKNFINSIS